MRIKILEFKAFNVSVHRVLKMLLEHKIVCKEVRNKNTWKVNFWSFSQHITDEKADVTGHVELH